MFQNNESIPNELQQALDETMLLSLDKLIEEFKGQHAAIPWRAMKGLRNRIVHEYGNVDLGVVYDTVRNDIPQLLKELKEIQE